MNQPGTRRLTKCFWVQRWRPMTSIMQSAGVVLRRSKASGSARRTASNVSRLASSAARTDSCRSLASRLSRSRSVS